MKFLILIITFLLFFSGCINDTKVNVSNYEKKSLLNSNTDSKMFSKSTINNIKKNDSVQLKFKNNFILYDSKKNFLKSEKKIFDQNNLLLVKYPYILSTLNEGNNQSINSSLILYNLLSSKEIKAPTFLESFNIPNLDSCLLDNNLIAFPGAYLKENKDDDVYRKIYFYNMNFETIDFDLKFKPSDVQSKINFNSIYFPEITNYEKSNFNKNLILINSITYNKYSNQYIISYSDSAGICLLHLQIFDEKGQYVKDITFQDRYQGINGNGVIEQNKIYSLSDHEILLYRGMALDDDVENGFSQWLYIDTNISLAKEIPITYVDCINTDNRTLVVTSKNEFSEAEKAIVTIDKKGNLNLISEFDPEKNKNFITSFSYLTEKKYIQFKKINYPYYCSTNYFYLLGYDTEKNKVYLLKYLYESQEYKISCELPYKKGYKYSIVYVDSDQNVWIYICD